MAKLNILLGFLWAAGCGSLSMAQDSNVTVHSQTTAQSPGASTTHTVPINIASSVTTLVATTMTTTANILTPTTKAGTGFTTPLSSSSSTSSSLSISSSNAIVTTVENPKSSTNGTTEKATDKPTTEKARETATQLPGAATVQPSRSPTTSSTVSPATSETSQPNSTLTTTMPASATSNSSVFSQQTSVPQAHDGKATTSVNVTASALPSTSSSTASSVTSSPSFSLSSSNSTPYIATSIKTTESTTTSVPTTSVDLFPTTTFTKTTKSTVISQVQIQVTCEKIIFNDSQIKMNMKVPQNCNSETMQGLFEMQGKKNFMEQLCKAVKPGFQPSVDNCKVVFGYNGQLNDQLAIVEAMVETRLNPQDLYAKLKDEKTKEGLPLFSYASKEAIVDEDWLSLPLIITIVCMAVSLLIIAAIYGCWHQKQSHKREQASINAKRLTEELQTMENGYHDNPTLEVMETAPEMQEKKGGLNGELGDSWIVPLDNLTREDLEEEEDTHL